MRKKPRKDNPAFGIYPDALGAKWTRLGEPLRKLHDRKVKRVWKGSFRIENGPHWLGKIIIGGMRLPRATPKTPLQLRIERFKNGEKWFRQIGTHQLVTTQFAGKNRRILERMDGLEFAFDLVANKGGLVYRQTSCGLRLGFLFIPLPKILSPRIEAAEKPSGKNILVSVAIHAPIAGLIISYNGRISL